MAGVRCKTFSTNIRHEAAEVAPEEEKITPLTEKQIFHTLEEALEFVLPFAVDKPKEANYDVQPWIESGLDSLPGEVNGPWKMDSDTIKRSLKYIYEKLHHTCYVMCVKGGKPLLKKLEPDGIPKFYQEEIEKKEAINKDMFRVLAGKEARVMQCVIKPRSDKESVSAEYMKFINEFPLALPDGVYILNLTDAVIYRKDGRHPWKSMKAELGVKDIEPFLPVLGGSGAKGYWDVPMPNYDDLNLATSRKGLPAFPTDWSKKKNVAVFRGGPTGCGTNKDTNMRIKLAGMKRYDLDVGLVREKSNNPRYNAKRGGIFMMDLGGVPPVPFMTPEEQSKHKYIIHIDGNVAAYRLLNTMLMGSVVLKVEGPYTLWVDHLIRDKEHYVSVKEDLSDLFEVLNWCKAHDEECKRIAENGKVFALKVLTEAYVTSSFAKLVWGIVDKSIPTPVSSSSESTASTRNTPPPAPPLGAKGKKASEVLAGAAEKLKGLVGIEPSPTVAAPSAKAAGLAAQRLAELRAKTANPPAAVEAAPPAPPAVPQMSAIEKFKLAKAKRNAEAAAKAAAKKGGRRTRRYVGYRRRITRKV
jgi:hypothetical protein